MWISRKVATTFTTCHHVIFYKNGRVYQNILNCPSRKNMLQKMTWSKMFYRSSSIHYKFNDASLGKWHELKCYIDHHPYTISSMMHRLYLPWAMATVLYIMIHRLKMHRLSWHDKQIKTQFCCDNKAQIYHPMKTERWISHNT